MPAKNVEDSVPWMIVLYWVYRFVLQLRLHMHYSRRFFFDLQCRFKNTDHVHCFADIMTPMGMVGECFLAHYVPSPFYCPSDRTGLEAVPGQKWHGLGPALCSLCLARHCFNTRQAVSTLWLPLCATARFITAISMQVASSRGEDVRSSYSAAQILVGIFKGANAICEISNSNGFVTLGEGGQEP